MGDAAREPTLAEVHAEQVEIRRLLAAILGTLRARKAAPAKRTRTRAKEAGKVAAAEHVPNELHIAMVRRAMARGARR